jgi:hypothetical protein
MKVPALVRFEGNLVDYLGLAEELHDDRFAAVVPHDEVTVVAALLDAESSFDGGASNSDGARR